MVLNGFNITFYYKKSSFDGIWLTPLIATDEENESFFFPTQILLFL
ncbi:hypothetical protein FH5_05143 [Priestia endophytica]|nr:hypothetical protein FH5_05143 [Priestia endophytica]